MYQEALFVSKSGVDVHYYVFKPIIRVRYKAVIQIHHGMAEHALRYQNFCEFLAHHGYVVVVSDHVGHGKSLIRNELGFFGDQNGWNTLVEDMQQLNRILYHEYPDLPLFLFAHSMGSFVARDYASRYGEYINGLILSGTGCQDKMLTLNKWLLNIMKICKGKHYRSSFINKVSFGSYNDKFKPTRTANDWLSRDEKQVDAYNNDPLCGFIFTLQAYKDLIDGFIRLKNPKNIKSIPKDLPILLIAGSDDPVGHFGKDIEKLHHQYTQANIKNVTMEIIPNARHEVLNETNKGEVYMSVFNWFENQIGY